MDAKAVAAARKRAAAQPTAANQLLLALELRKAAAAVSESAPGARVEANLLLEATLLGEACTVYARADVVGKGSRAEIADFYGGAQRILSVAESVFVRGDVPVDTKLAVARQAVEATRYLVQKLPQGDMEGALGTALMLVAYTLEMKRQTAAAVEAAEETIRLLRTHRHAPAVRAYNLRTLAKALLYRAGRPQPPGPGIGQPGAPMAMEAVKIMLDNYERPGNQPTTSEADEVCTTLMTACELLGFAGRRAEAVQLATKALAVYDAHRQGRGGAAAAAVGRGPHFNMQVAGDGSVAAATDLRTSIRFTLGKWLMLRGESEMDNPDPSVPRTTFRESLEHLRAAHAAAPGNEQFAAALAIVLEFLSSRIDGDRPGSARDALDCVAYTDEALALCRRQRGPAEDEAKFVWRRARLMLRVGLPAEASKGASEAMRLMRPSGTRAPRTLEKDLLYAAILFTFAEAETFLDRFDNAVAAATEAAEIQRRERARIHEVVATGKVPAAEKEELAKMYWLVLADIAHNVAANTACELRRGRFAAAVTAAKEAADLARAAHARGMARAKGAEPLAYTLTKLSRWILLGSAGLDDIETARAMAEEAAFALLTTPTPGGSSFLSGGDTPSEDLSLLAQANLVMQAAIACGVGATPQVATLLAEVRKAAAAAPRDVAFDTAMWELVSKVHRLGVNARACPIAALAVETILNRGPGAAAAVHGDWASTIASACAYAAACCDAAGYRANAATLREDAVKALFWAPDAR